jgi:Ca2+-binding RTX toxin-like protein
MASGRAALALGRSVQEENWMRRRAILLLMTMAATLVLSSGVALAINTIQCNEGGRVICRGTNESDRMLGTDEKNTMFAKGRGDILKGFDASDFLNGDRGNDELYGGSAKDTLNGGPDNDVLEAGQGHDWYDIRENEWGNDHITDTALPDKII